MEESMDLHPHEVSYQKRAFGYISAMDDAVSSVDGNTLDRYDLGSRMNPIVDNDPSVTMESEASSQAYTSQSRVVDPPLSHSGQENVCIEKSNSNFHVMFKKVHESKGRRMDDDISSLAETVDDYQDAVIAAKKKQLLEKANGRKVVDSSLEDGTRETTDSRLSRTRNGPSRPGRSRYPVSPERKRPPVMILKRENSGLLVEKENPSRLPSFAKWAIAVCASIFLLSMAGIAVAVYLSHQQDNASGSDPAIVAVVSNDNDTSNSTTGSTKPYGVSEASHSDIFSSKPMEEGDVNAYTDSEGGDSSNLNRPCGLVMVEQLAREDS